MTEKTVKGFLFRLKPNDKQKKRLEETFGCVRKMHNELVSDLRKGQVRTIPQIKNQFKYMLENDSQAYTSEWKYVQQGYKNSKKGTHGSLNMKKKYDSVHSYTSHTTNNNIRIQGKKLKLPKIGFVTIKLHRPIPSDGVIKAVTVKREGREYYASLRVEYTIDIKQNQTGFERAVGLDYSPSKLFVDQYGNSPSSVSKYISLMKKIDEKIKRENKILSRKTVKSNRWVKQKNKLRKLYQHQKNIRNDFLHKESRKLVNAYDSVYIEDLNLKSMGEKPEHIDTIKQDYTEMSKAKHRRKSMFRASYGNFTKMLEYKLHDEGKKLIRINRYFPSTKTCPICKSVKASMPLDVRTYKCDCGHEMDRDQNAALNIVIEGILTQFKEPLKEIKTKWVTDKQKPIIQQ